MVNARLRTLALVALVLAVLLGVGLPVGARVWASGASTRQLAVTAAHLTSPSAATTAAAQVAAAYPAQGATAGVTAAVTKAAGTAGLVVTGLQVRPGAGDQVTWSFTLSPVKGADLHGKPWPSVPERALHLAAAVPDSLPARVTQVTAKAASVTLRLDGVAPAGW